jgi:hypothetical protein
MKIVTSIAVISALSISTLLQAQIKVDTGGDVGIGTESPTQKLEVTGNIITELSNNMTNYIASGYSNSTASRPTFQIIRSRGIQSSKLAVINNDALGAFFFGGYDGTNYQYGGACYSYVDGTVSTGSVPTRISFVTGSNSSNRSERLVIKSSGNVGIGLVSPYYKLDVEGQIRAENVTVSSDARLKEDIEDLTADASLTQVSQLRPVKYKVKIPVRENKAIKDSLSENLNLATQVTTSSVPVELSESEEDFYSRIHTGFVAQEVQDVYPHLVYEDNNGMLSVDYISMIPIMVAALKEQQEEIDALKKEIKKMKE